jgi:hypothetical protein
VTVAMSKAKPATFSDIIMRLSMLPQYFPLRLAL